MFVQTVCRRFLAAQNNHVEFWWCTKINYIEIIEVLDWSDYTFSSSLLSSSKDFEVLFLFTNAVKFDFTSRFFSCENQRMILATRNLEGV